MMVNDGYPLVNVYSLRTGKSPFSSWVNQLFLWAIFNSYVKLSSGKRLQFANWKMAHGNRWFTY